MLYESLRIRLLVTWTVRALFVYKIKKKIAYVVTVAMIYNLHIIYVWNIHESTKNQLHVFIGKNPWQFGTWHVTELGLTCICCQIMEHIMLSHVSKHLTSNNILIDAQHRFRQKLSTTTQLAAATHNWSYTLQQRGQTDVIFLDFSKAFDRVPHQRLALKLDHYGINSPALCLIRSFLATRSQAVSVNGTH